MSQLVSDFPRMTFSVLLVAIEIIEKFAQDTFGFGCWPDGYDDLYESAPAG